MVFANLLLCMSMTMLIPTVPAWLLYHEGLTTVETGLAMGAFGLGVFLPGPLCSYLVQRFRRNMVCVWSILTLAVVTLIPVYITHIPFLWAVLLRGVQGMTYGLALIVLSSTLIIDTCESFQRTEANHSSTWFGRFALSLGPTLGLLITQQLDMKMVFWASAVCCLLSALLIMLVHFPFRVPSDHVCKFSFDRFLLVQGWPLLLNFVPITIAVGMLLSLPLSLDYYAMMMIGFLMALLAQRFVFPDAELKSEIVSGLLLMMGGILIMRFIPASLLCSPLIGLGVGIMSTRFLLFFIKLSRHCQRGTAQSTFLMGWEVGLALGIGFGFLFFEGAKELLLMCSLGIITVALVCYVLFTHNWFVANKNR